MDRAGLKIRTTTCRVCGAEKDLSEFSRKNFGDVIVIDDICLHCDSFGRPSLGELLARPHAGGRPKLTLPLNKIKELHQQGLGYKAIAKKLREDGYNISHTTVRRKLLEMGN